jgi:prolipoprotein diacylglyceryltransferase
VNIYSVLLLLAGAAGFLAVWRGRPQVQVAAIGLAIGLFVLFCGRLGYIVLNWDYFREHTREIIALNGISEHSVLVGYVLLVIGNALFANDKLPIAAYHPLIPLIGIAASLGCIPNGCAYGREVFWQTDGANSLAWLLRADWPDAYLVNNPRWPTQAMMVGWLLITSAVLFALTRSQERLEKQGNKKTRQSENPLSSFCLVCLVPMSFAMGDFLIQFLRGEPAHIFAGLRIYQWLDVALSGCVAVIWFIAIIKRAPLESPEPTLPNNQ